MTRNARPRFPRRSREIRLGLLLAVAAGLLACERRRCVDANGVMVEDERCAEPDGGVGHAGGAHWYYYGSGRRYSTWSYFWSGGTSHGTSAGHSSSVSRGGFGHAGASHGGS